MYRSIIVFLFFLITSHLSFSQQYINPGVRIRFACDSCSYNHNPLAFLGGNIESASIVEMPDGKCLKLVSSSVIDTNAVPAYFDIYSTTWVLTYDTCNSFRKLDEVVDCAYGEFQIVINSSINSAGFRVWLASSEEEPASGETTYQTISSDASSSVIFQGVSYINPNSKGYYTFNLTNESQLSTWNLKSQVNLYGFTALKPNVEYYIWEVNMGQFLVTKLAGYDCSLPSAIMDETLKDKIKIYPVPTSDNLVVEISDYERGCYVEVISSEGKVIHHNFYSGNMHLKMNEYNKGMYLVKVTMGNSYYTKKVLKE